MSKAGKRIIRSAKEVLRIIRLRGGPGNDFPCNDPNMIECAIWECQKEGRCQGSAHVSGGKES